MKKVLFSFVTFGGINFTKELVDSVRRTTSYPLDFFAVIGKPGDDETEKYFDEEGIAYVYHNTNKGFPASVNDLYDYAWKKHDYDYLILAGNDTIAYPYTVETMIKTAMDTEHELISAREYDVKTLVAQYPETKQYFEGENYVIKDFSGKPWDKFEEYKLPTLIEYNVIKDLQNFALYKKSIFDKIGYTDVNFFPAYYIDNDYARRMVNANINAVSLNNLFYFHFWSRTIKQGSGGSTNHYFNNNRAYYIAKWGGDFGQEAYKIPFNGKEFILGDDILLPASLEICDRKDEAKIVEYWKYR